MRINSYRSGIVPGGPSLGQRNLSYHLEGAGVTPITLSLGSTQAAGSSIVVAHFGRFTSLGTPTDNKGNSFDNGTPDYLEQSGYAGGLWSGFGMSLFVDPVAAGGSAHSISVAKSGSAFEEATLIAIEGMNAGVMQDSSIVPRAAAGAGATLTSDTVTTTGPALLCGFWTGDGDVNTDPQDVGPGPGWTLLEQIALESAQAPNGHIQAALLARVVSAAGTYSLQVVPQANQGGILGLVALQRTP